METLKTDGFIETSRKKGHISATLGEEKLDSNYDAVNYINAQGNIGYTAATIEGNTICFFCSITAKGLVTTFPDPGIGGDKEMTIRGTKMRFAPVKASLKELLTEHRKAIQTESVVMNRPRVEKELDTLPQKIIELLKDLAMQMEQKGGSQR
jgi:hypothetical protein